MVMVRDADDLTSADSYARTIFHKFGEKWTDLSLSLDTFLLLGKQIIAEVVHLIDYDLPSETRRQLTEAFFYLYRNATTFTLQPILMNQNLMTQASTFYASVAEELKWSSKFKEQRLFEVQTEISVTGTYTHTSEELEIGARLAWRNSAKCIGR
jgi:hypothetical protein